MCIIAAKPAGVKWLEESKMKNCFLANSDGAGLAWAVDSGVCISKGYFDWEHLWQDMKALENYSVLLHCRYATNGSIKRSNCHPFRLKNGTVMAHNGVIDIEAEGDMTDSETFGKSYLEQFSIKELEDERIRFLLETVIGNGNKIVMLKKDGSFIFLNKQAGIEHKGIWFSNSGFSISPYVWDDLDYFAFLLDKDYLEAFGLADNKYLAYLRNKGECSVVKGRAYSEGFSDRDLGILSALEEYSDPYYANDFCPNGSVLF